MTNVIGGRGIDFLTGNGVANELHGLGGGDKLTGGGGDDKLYGGEGGDTLEGDAGKDTLDGGSGADKLYGGAGTEDIATYASAEAGVTVDLTGGTLSLGKGDAAGDTYTGIEQYVGSEHDDVFIAGDDDDNIHGGTGGSDTVSYEKSDKGVWVDLDYDHPADSDTTGTYAQPGVNVDHDNNMKYTCSKYSNPAGSYAAGDILAGIKNVTGSPHIDNLTAGSAGSVITGGKGDDILAGDMGNDTFVFTSGDGSDQINTFTITGGQDKIDLSAFTSIASLDDLKGKISLRDSNTDIRINLPGEDDITLNNVTPDTAKDFYGLTADNFIFYTKPISGNIGDRFNNEINGGRGNDVIYGEQGRDIIDGGAGDDDLYGGEDKDTLNGGEDKDTLNGGPGDDTLNGGPGNDVLDGGPGDDILDGAGEDEDTLNTGEDNDILYGGPGNDTLTGGSGNDTFVFEPGNGNDSITSFSATDDKIDLSAFNIASADLPGLISIHEGNVRINLTTKGGGTIKLTGVTDIDDLDGAGGTNNNTLNGKYKYTGDLNNDGDFNDTVNSVVESDGVFIL